MRAEELISLAAAHGIDLRHVAGNASNDKGIARKRRRPQKEIDDACGRPLLETVTGSQSRVARAPRWSIAELGQAAAGIRPIPWMAACYSFAHDDSAYWPLHEALVREAYILKRRHHWPAQIMGTDGLPRLYLQELALLVLDCDWHGRYFVAAPATDKRPSLYAIYVHIEESLWRGRIEDRFEALRARYHLWLETARGMIQRQLSRHDDEILDEAG